MLSKIKCGKCRVVMVVVFQFCFLCALDMFPLFYFRVKCYSGVTVFLGR